MLWAEPTENPYDLRGNGFMVWESKTQGRSYHFAMLAAVKNDEMHFCHQRLYLLENPRVRRLLAGGR